MLCVAVLAALLAGDPAAARPSRPVQQGPSTESEAAPGSGAAPGLAVLGATELPDPVLDLLPVTPTSSTERADARLEDRRRDEEAAAAGWLTAERDRLFANDAEAAAGLAVFTDEVRLAEAAAAVDTQRAVWRAAAAITSRRFDALEAERRQLRTVAAAVFTSEPNDAFGSFGPPDLMAETAQRDAYRGRLVDIQVGIVDRRAASWRRARSTSDAEARRLRRRELERDARSRELAEAVADRDRKTAVRAATEDTARQRKGDLDTATERRQSARDDRRKARLLATVPFTDLPLVAVDAYWKASGRAPCRLPWWVLAGVGKVETHHGTAHGSRLTETGDTTVPIFGIPLDGRPGTMLIPDSDGGRLDGDGAFDRAVGPMQFLPGTWGVVGADGNDDGRADPHNLYDAATAAGRLLCLGRGDLVDDSQYRSALLSYNNSLPYGNQVLGLAHRYQALIGLPDVPPDPSSPTEAAGGP